MIPRSDVPEFLSLGNSLESAKYLERERTMRGLPCFRSCGIAREQSSPDYSLELPNTIEANLEASHREEALGRHAENSS